MDLDLGSETLIFAFFIIQSLFFTLFLLYFVHSMSRTGKGVLRCRIFRNATPVVKAFYQLFMGASFSYILFLIYFINPQYIELFILGEVVLGLSLIGFAYLTVPLFTYRKPK